MALKCCPVLACTAEAQRRPAGGGIRVGVKFARGDSPGIHAAALVDEQIRGCCRRVVCEASLVPGTRPRSMCSQHVRYGIRKVVWRPFVKVDSGRNGRAKIIPRTVLDGAVRIGVGGLEVVRHRHA